MAPSADFLIEKAQDDNLKAFETWLNANKKTLAPQTNLGVIYAGQKIVGKMLPSGILLDGSMKADATPMWKFIKLWNDMHKQVHGKLRYETVEDVLKRLTPPRIKWTQGKACGIIKVMTNMYDCANDLSSDKEQMLAKPARKKVWTALSKVYVANIKGELNILEGVMKDYKRLDETKIMIQTEIPELLKNQDLNAKSRVELQELYKTYKSVYEKQKNLG
jgi:hypothetical protein